MPNGSGRCGRAPTWTASPAQLALIEQIAAGEVASGPLADMSQSERFHWLTTPRSTAVQPGPIHGGMADDPDATFEHLYSTLVDRS